jgi:pilus assembly protein Flp/PilA
MTLIIATLKEASSDARHHRYSRAGERTLADRGRRSKTAGPTRAKGKTMPRLKNRRGQGLVEYVLVLVLMAVLSVGALRFLGTKTHNAFAQAGSALSDEMSYSSSNAKTTGTIN